MVAGGGGAAGRGMTCTRTVKSRCRMLLCRHEDYHPCVYVSARVHVVS